MDSTNIKILNEINNFDKKALNALEKMILQQKICEMDS